MAISQKKLKEIQKTLSEIQAKALKIQSQATQLEAQQAPTNTGGYVTLYDNSGKRVDVSPSDVAEAKGRGYTSTSPPSGGNGDGNGDGSKIPDWQSIIDNNYQNIVDLIEKTWAQKEAVQDYQWTDADTQTIAGEFNELYGGYYGQAEATARLGAREGFERQSRSLSEAIMDSQASMASQGLAFSGEKQAEAGRLKKIVSEANTEQLRELEGKLGSQATKSWAEQMGIDYQLPQEYAGLGLTTPKTPWTTAGQDIFGIPGTIPTQKWGDWRDVLASRKVEAQQYGSLIAPEN